MLNDPHSLGTYLAKILTIINVHVGFGIIRQHGCGFQNTPLTKHNWLISNLPLIELRHALNEEITLKDCS